jgi:hypothetical protein
MLPVEIEIGLERAEIHRYTVDCRFRNPEDEADRAPVRGSARFDLVAQREQMLDVAAYGRLLSQALFGDAAVREYFLEACAVAQSLGAPLRVRLLVGPSATELRGLRWETVRDPRDDRALVTSERILFSRFLHSLDWRPVRLRSKGDLRALVVIANPADITQWRPGGQPLALLDVPAELARAKAALAEVPTTALASGGSATLNGLCAHLREGYDILYLVCHGALFRLEEQEQPEPLLWLENEDGSSARVKGEELATRLRELQYPPRLAVLASCESAGTEAAGRAEESPVTALGPRLAEAGVPAVVAMQGSIAVETAARFTPVFFRELLRDGQIDRAMAVARGAVREAPDAWMPTLFMRLRSGRIWYVPSFGGEQKEFEKWPALLRCLQDGRSTPILGPGLVEPLFGTSREIARRWAERFQFPLAPHDLDNLPQVAQYLSVKQDALWLI